MDAYVRLICAYIASMGRNTTDAESSMIPLPWDEEQKQRSELQVRAEMVRQAQIRRNAQLEGGHR